MEQDTPKESAIDLSVPACRKGDEQFSHYWNVFIPSIKNRENLKEGHLEILRIFCDMMCDLDELQAKIKDEMTYETEGRYGIQIKVRPEVIMKKDLLKDIHRYAGLLGLSLVKDSDMSNNPEKEGGLFE